MCLGVAQESTVSASTPSYAKQDCQGPHLGKSMIRQKLTLENLELHFLQIWTCAMTTNLVFQAPREPQTELTQKPDASLSPRPLVSILLDDGDGAFLPVRHPFPLSLLILWIIHIPSPNGSS